MAAGDISRDSTVLSMGNTRVLTGTIEVDDTLRAFALRGNTLASIVTCNVDCEDGVGSAKVLLNQDASATTTAGTIAVQGDDTTTRTYRFQAVFAAW